MALLNLVDIRFGRGTRTLGEGVNLSLGAGQVAHLVGANGAGKTTLLEVAAGLRRPWGGHRHCAAALHWLGHRNALAAPLSPLQNLDAWRALQTDVDAAPLAALQQLGVYRVRNRPCRDLSAGQKRRAALARLLLARRALWVLDEPLDGLDRAGLDQVAELINRHTDEGGAVLVTSHQALPDAVRSVTTVQLGLATA